MKKTLLNEDRYDPTTMGSSLIASANIRGDVQRDGNNDLETPSESSGFEDNDHQPGSILDYRRRGQLITRKSLILGFLTVAVLAGVAVGIVFAVKGGQSDCDDSSADCPSESGATAGSTTQQIGDISPPPENLSTVCSTLSLGTLGGYNTCYEICSKAECCRLPAGEALSCVDEHEEDCATYAAECANLGIEIPPPPSNLASICAPSRLSTLEGFQQCESTCDRAKCCNDHDHKFDEAQCSVVTNLQLCDLYDEACAILHGNPDSHPDSVSSLVQTSCTTTALTSDAGVNRCRGVCEPAQCCFVSTPLENDGQVNPFNLVSSSESACVTEETMNWCAQYAGCYALFHVDRDGFDNHEEAKSVIEQACSDVASEVGFRECKNVCNPARCCFQPKGSEKDCASTGMEANVDCSHYESCGVLHETAADDVLDGDVSGFTLLELAEHVVGYCSKSSLTTPHGRSGCERLCSDKLCCFAEDPTDNCVSDPSENCIVYAGCQNLLSHNADGPLDESSVTEQLSTACSETSMNTATGLRQCHDLCQYHLCCFTNHIDENCYDDHPAVCDTYSPCSVLANPPPAVDTGGDGTTSDGEITESMVMKACSSISITGPTGLAQCHSLCGQRLCCFVDPSLKSSCADMPEFHCDDVYAPCQILVDSEFDTSTAGTSSAKEVEIPNAPGDLSTICSSTAFETTEGYQMCEDICERAKCCNEPIELCKVLNADECDRYDPCMILSLDPVERVQEVCAETNVATVDGRAMCERLCSERSCCFKSGAGNCYTTDQHWCDEFQICENLEDSTQDNTEEVGSGSEGENDLLPDLQACTSDKVSTQSGKKACAHVCLGRMCCFIDGTESCKEEKKDWCEEYNLCWTVFPGGYATMDSDAVFLDKAPSNLVDICSPTNLAAVEGFSACEKICEEAKCCQASNEDCEVLNQEVCTEYKPCDILTEGVAALVSEVCSEELVVFENGRAMCEKLCSQRSCCFAGTADNCYEAKKEWCDEFQDCQNLDDYTVGNPDSGGDSDNIHPDMKACLPQMVSTETGKNICKEICLGRECCFKAGMESCRNEEEAWCMGYDLCLTVFPDGPFSESKEVEIPTAPSNLAEICSQSNLQHSTGRVACEKACEEAECCNERIEVCKVVNPDDCDAYDVCSILTDNDEDDAHHPDMEACTAIRVSKESGKQICKEICLGRKCCFVTGLEGCQEEEKEWCDEYDICWEVFPEGFASSDVGKSASTTETEADMALHIIQKEVEEVCIHLFHFDNGEACRDICNPSKCCFVNGSGSCLESDPDGCAVFKSCESVFAKGTAGSP